MGEGGGVWIGRRGIEKQDVRSVEKDRRLLIPKQHLERGDRERNLGLNVPIERPITHQHESQLAAGCQFICLQIASL